jgi:hypothetical protein
MADLDRQIKEWRDKRNFLKIGETGGATPLTPPADAIVEDDIPF